MKLRYQVLAALTAALVAASAALATPSGRSMSNVWRFSDGSAVMGARSSVVRTDQGASFTIRTSDLAAGDAVTVWWVVFNNPEFCTAGEGDFRCGIGDLLPFGGDPRVDSSAFYAAGHVIGGSGMAGFGGHTTTGGPTGEVLWGPGLVNARTADIHLVVRTHGPALVEYLPGQIKSFGVACANEPLELGGGGPNTCADVQFAVHEP